MPKAVRLRKALRRMGIAYTIYGGISFYQRKEIKDYIAYLRILVNPNDEEALKRIINYPVQEVLVKLRLIKPFLLPTKTIFLSGRYWNVRRHLDIKEEHLSHL